MIWRNVLRFVLRLLFHLRVEGHTHLLPSDRIMYVANCDSSVDGVMLGLFLPGEITVALTRDMLRYPLIRLFARIVPHVAIDSHPLALKKLMRLVESGRPIAIFPEGRPTVTGSQMKIYDSAAVIAAHCGACIVPVHIDGTLYSYFSSVGGNFPKRLFPRVRIVVGSPQPLPNLPPLSTKPRRRKLAQAVLKIMQHMRFVSMPPRTLFEALLDIAELHGYSTRILEDTQREYSYGDLIKAGLVMGKLVCRLSDEREIVGILMPNIAITVSLVFGLSAMRRVPAMLNYTAGPDALRGACIAAGIRTVISSRRFVKVMKLENQIAALDAVRIVYLEDLQTQLGMTDKLWLLVWALWRPRSVMRGTDPEETAVVLFTSGSEAHPKGVVLSHRALLSNMAQIGAVIDFGPNDKFLSALPMYHSYSLTACTLMPLLTGTRVYLYMTPLHYHAIPEIAYTRACTYVFGTSTFLGQYATQAHPYDFFSMRVVVSGAEKLSPEVANHWLEKFGIRIMEGYGATECAPVLSLNTPLCYKPGTVGQFLPGIQHRIVPVSGIERGGVLHVCGPNLMRGYYLFEKPGILQPPQSEVGPGWYNTGDIVEMDDDGFITVHGRVRRFAKIAGEMVSLEVVENIARHASPKYQHAVTVELMAQSGERTVLFTTDPGLSRVSLQKAARELGSQELAVARRIVVVREIPLLGSGKTDYVRLHRMASF